MTVSSCSRRACSRLSAVETEDREQARRLHEELFIAHIDFRVLVYVKNILLLGSVATMCGCTGERPGDGFENWRNA